MKLTLENGRYIFYCQISERWPASEAKFAWNHKDAPGVWSTDSARRALKCAAYADEELRAAILEAAQSEPDPDRISLTFDGSTYRFYSPYDYRALGQSAGMTGAKHPRWHWWTTDPECAVRVFNNCAQYEGLFDCAPELRAQLESHLEQRNASLEASRALDAEIDIPAPPGCEYLPFQRAGVRFMIDHHNTLLADSMGLGKSIQAIGLANAVGANRILVIAPASLKVHWRREFEKWDTNGLSIGIGESQVWPDTDVVIINYDALGRASVGGKKVLRREIRDVEWDILILDEIHYCKNAKTLRSKFALAVKSKRTLALTGTPIPNRVRELWPIAHRLAPDDFPEWWPFAKRFCAMTRGPFGWDTSGASNLAELQAKLRSTCFPFYVIVETDRGSIPIGEIVEKKLAVKILSYDHKSTKMEWRSIAAYSKRSAPSRLLRVTHELGQFDCTADHRVWTQNGYTRADALTPEVYLSTLPEAQNNYSKGRNREREVLLDQVRRNSQRASRDIKTKSDSNETTEAIRPTQKEVQVVPGNNTTPEREWRQREMERPSILQPIVQCSVETNSTRSTDSSSENVGRPSEPIRRVQKGGGHERRRVSAWTIPFSQDPQTYVESAKATVAKNQPTDGSYLQDLTTGVGATCRAEISAELAGSAGRDQATSWPLQKGREISPNDRHHSFTNKNSNRSGWADTPNANTTGTRPLEGKATFCSRVVGVEVLKQRYRSEPPWSERDSQFVYDIEIEGNHNFFANGILVHNCMVRRLKSEVLRELPPKRRQVIELPSAGLKRFIDAEQSALSQHQEMLDELRVKTELAKASEDPEEQAEAVKALRDGARVAFEEMSRRRHETALAKLPLVVEHITDMLEEVPKVLIFAHHVDVIKELASIYKCGFIYGAVPPADRLGIVDEFNNNPNEKVLVCQSETGGVGFSVKASHVIAVELEWVPGTMTQCEDRCHGIGRGIEGEPLLVQHLVLEGSLDAQMARTLIAKQEIADRALDRQGGIDVALDDVDTDFEAEDLVLPEKLASTDESVLHSRPATYDVKREQIAKEAATLTQDQVELVHQGLKTLAGMCDGAFARDSVGFNGMDARIGKALAQAPALSKAQAALGRRIVGRYRNTQLKGIVDSLWNEN